MNEVLRRLARLHAEQLDLYDQVLELADAAVQAAREGRPLQEIDVLLTRKRQLLADVDRLDALAEPDRRWAKEAGRSPTETSPLRRTLADCARRIEQILEREREMERWILMRGDDARDLRASSGAGE